MGYIYSDKQKDFQEQLKKLALQRSKPFCYSCYKVAPTGRCETCGSDDLMRELKGVGVEYGTEWIVEHLLSEEVEGITREKTEEGFQQQIDEIYGQTVKIGFLEYDTSSAIKELDPISYDQAWSEYIDQLLDDECLITFDDGSTFYEPDTLEDFLSELEEEKEAV